MGSGGNGGGSNGVGFAVPLLLLSLWLLVAVGFAEDDKEESGRRDFPLSANVIFWPDCDPKLPWSIGSSADKCAA